MRKFVSQDLKIESFADIEPYYNTLLSTPLLSKSQVDEWLSNWSELDSVVSEDGAWRYIKMSQNTADEVAAESFEKFVTEIAPKIAPKENEVNKRFMLPEVQVHVNKSELFTMIRSVKTQLELFREENIPLQSQLEQLEQEYGKICSQMSVEVDGKTLTLQQAANYLKDSNRDVRKSVYEKINQRRMADKKAIDELLDKQIALRQQIAQNAGFDNYIDYRFKALGRFDYTVDDCRRFHNSIAKVVVPIVERFHAERKAKMGVDQLRPYDLDVDLYADKPLRPFETIDELVKKSMYCFRDVAPEFGIMINNMNIAGRLDLESRMGKAPGGFNYPLHETTIPFIFMNATNNLRDMVTLMHEGGHAVHAFLCDNLPYVSLKDTPAEIAELASMSMELITMANWHHFFANADELTRAKRIQLEDVIEALPWIAAIDKFQLYLYTHPGHSHAERSEAWAAIKKEFGSSLVDYSGYEDYYNNQWQKQLHIFEVPLYYIEYGFAQLGAISIWKLFCENKNEALEKFKLALSKGYSLSIPEIYQCAGIQFNADESYIKSLMDFVTSELAKL